MYLPECQVKVDCQGSAVCLDEHQTPFLNSLYLGHDAEYMFCHKMSGGPPAAVSAYSRTILSQNRARYLMTKMSVLLLWES